MTKKKLPILFIMLSMMISISPSLLPEQNQKAAEEWWYIPFPQPFNPEGFENSLGFIRVKGNKFVDEGGNPILFQGVNISDPDKLEKNGHWDKNHFKVIKDWGANIVRIPIHPIAWRERGMEGYFALLDQAVIWANDLGLYLIVEWHCCGNLVSGLFHHPMHQTTKQETYQFWKSMSFRYKDISALAFYEIFNEPTVFNGQLGSMPWTEWKTINEEIISIIFAHDRKKIPLVAGFNWAYDLKPVKDAPVARKEIGYVSHPYPQKTFRPYEPNWERDFGFVADTYPLFATELGFMAADDPGAHIPVISDEEYGRAIIRYFKKKGISWTAWCFDPDWPPQLIADWDYTPTKQGAFFRKVMKEGN